jgi:ADP-heptose:LPS heptosyltransferase
MRLVRPDHHPAADLGGPVDWSSVRRILAVRTDNLGDVVMLTPALRALSAVAPRARIDLLASPAGAAAGPLIPELTEVLTASVSWQQTGAAGDPAAEHALVERIRAGGYDVMLVFTSATQSPWPAAYAGLLAGIGIRAVHSAEFGGAVATHWVSPPPDGTHQVDRCLHLLAALGVPPAGRALRLLVPLLMSDVDTEPYVLLAPGASCPSKRYPARRFAEVAALLARRGTRVLVTGTDRERDLVESIVEQSGHERVRPLLGLDVPALVSAVAHADVVLCNNSACLHLADAVGTPVVATYAGTERLVDMRPRSTRATLLGREVPCSPCRQFRCPYRQQCLDLDPADVAAATERLAPRRAVRAS